MRAFLPPICLAIALSPGLAALAAPGPIEVLRGPVSREDYDAALRVFGPAARRGDAGAQYNLGRLYSQGRGAAPDPGQAIVWFRKAAEQGHADAQLRLGEMLASGDGTAANSSEAEAWWRKAAAQGNSDAALRLATLDAARPAAAPTVPANLASSRFSAIMNGIFGPGQWRETSGYRTIAAENRLRAEGALTVRRGVISHHSMGTPAAPGAYDIVVAGMSPGEAAGKIRRSGVVFRRLFPESAHGDQGPHLHVEPVSARRVQLEALAGGGRKTSS